jgi:hypothetical protein
MRSVMIRIAALIGISSQVVLWIALGIGITAISRTLSVAKDAPEGDVAAITAILERSQVFVGWGKFIGLLGFVVLLVLVISKKERARWFLWSGLISSVVQFFLIPIGTALGAIGLLLFMRALRKSDEEPNQSPQPTALLGRG